MSWAVIDASLLVAFVSGGQRGDWVGAKLLDWQEQGVGLHAPSLAAYEVASALTQLVAAGRFPTAEVGAAWADILELPVSYHEVTDVLGIVSVARRLKRRSAYDAAYLALGERLGAALWTLDAPLARNATDIGYRVHLLEARS